MKKYKYFVKSLESILEPTPENKHLVEVSGWGNGYVIIPITHPFAGTKKYTEGIEGCQEIFYSKPVEEKAHWEEIDNSDYGMWLLGFHSGNKFEDGIEITKEYIEKETIKLRDALMKLG